MTLQFINYAIQISILTGVFYLVYVLIFKNQKQFGWNRVYLLSALFLSWLIPLINLPVDTLLDWNLVDTFQNCMGDGENRPYTV